jgi:autotransporter strand-loop-strand O-heptosyltransferase
MIGNIYFEILEAWEDKDYQVKIIEKKNGEIILLHEATLRTNMWIRSDRSYLGNYFVQVWDGDELKEEIDVLKHVTSLKTYITLGSKSIGDNLAWMPYCLEFKKHYGCDVVVSTFHNALFEKAYPELTFVNPGSVVNGIMSMFHIGWDWNKNNEPQEPNLIPLQKTATNILNLDFREIKPRLTFLLKKRPINDRYIAISTRSTSQAKHWYYWQDLINILKEKGYKVVEVSLEGSNFEGLEPIEDRSSENVMNLIHHSEFLIGLGSGSSWLAWALGKRVVMISNFSKDGHEFTTNCIRIKDTSICHGCWNSPMFKFNKGDWNWCPEHEHTDRQFECHKLISAEDVIKQIIKKGLLN